MEKAQGEADEAGCVYSHTMMQDKTDNERTTDLTSSLEWPNRRPLDSWNTLLRVARPRTIRFVSFVATRPIQAGLCRDMSRIGQVDPL